MPDVVVHAVDDPMFDPELIPELERRTSGNPHAQLLLTAKGGHVAHIGTATSEEDEFWALNRILEFCEGQLDNLELTANVDKAVVVLNESAIASVAISPS